MTDTADMIIWDPRHSNTYADHAANIALDINSDWRRLDSCALKQALEAESNFRACGDGALRGNGMGSGGMAVFAYSPDSSKQMHLRQGVVFGSLNSAFLNEALALEWCLREFLFLVKGVPGKSTYQQQAKGKGKVVF